MVEISGRIGAFNDRGRTRLAGGALAIALLAFLATMAVVPGGGLLGTAGQVDLTIYATDGGSVRTTPEGSTVGDLCHAPGPCTYSYVPGTTVLLVAEPDAKFAGWTSRG